MPMPISLNREYLMKHSAPLNVSVKVHEDRVVTLKQICQKPVSYLNSTIVLSLMQYALFFLTFSRYERGGER